MALDNNTVLYYTDKTTIKNWFKTGLKPTQTQFWSTWDSYWHKSESLPISSISGLGNLLDGKAEENHEHAQYAKNDATSLTADNVTAWQQKLGVADLDYVEIPTENAAENSHPYVVVIDDAGKSAKRNATDFGKVDTIDGIEADENKNIALGAVRKSESNTVTDDFSMQQENGAYVSIASNGLKVGFGGITATYGTSSIYVDNLVPDAAYKFQEILFPKRAVKNVEEKVYPVTYIQGVKADETGRVDISGVAMNWTNSSQRFSGLLDKSADATFNQFALFDSNGNLAKASQIANAFEAGLKNTTAEQGLRIGQLLNGGRGSSGTMSVNLVSPPIIQNRFDSVEYVLLRGSNLYLDNINYAIEILDESKTNVVATIPQNQVQLYADGTQLIFYYNFHQFLEGRYFIRLTSGSKVMITTLDLTIVQQVQDVNVDNLIWESNYASSEVKNPNTSVEGRNFAITTYKNEDENQTPVISYKTNEIFAQGEDFYIELNLTVSSYQPVTSVNSTMRSYIGLGYSSSPNSLAINSLVNINYRPSGGNNMNYFNNTISSGNSAITPAIINIIFIKTGNLFRTIIGNSNHSTTLSNNSGYSLFINIPKRLRAESINGQIIKAFKFN